MWKQSENSNNTKPSEVDYSSSEKYVIIRKDFEEVENVEDEGTHWRYMENHILKEDWETYQEIITNTNDVTDLQMAICDLYEMIGG